MSSISSGARRRTSQQEEHEAFKNRLVDEVLGQDVQPGRVPMEKVVMLIWQFRDDPTVVTFMARFVAKFAGSRDVFDGIEFYLPQLAHMIIHLEVGWDDAILERFALVIAQQSIHFALQFNWILQGALQDYHPEILEGEEADDNDAGKPNPNYHPTFYHRCQKLIKNLERCVVYGRPRAAELQRLYERGEITKKEMMILEQADRRFNALQITNADDNLHKDPLGKLDGWIYIQQPQSKTTTQRSPDEQRQQQEKQRPFVMRYCELENQVFNSYGRKGCCSGGGVTLSLDRAMVIERAKVTDVSVSKTSSYSGRESKLFTIHVETPKYSFSLRFSNEQEKNLWFRRLNEESETSALFQSQSFNVSQGLSAALTKSKKEGAIKDDLTTAELERYEFFQDERNFVDQLTALAEELRFKDRPERKKLAPELVSKLVIPDRVYLPLCNSSDIWRRVASPVGKETRVFNTKARCPTVINFISKRGELNTATDTVIDPNVDVAEFMHQYLDVVAETTEEEGETAAGGKTIVEGENEDGNDDGEKEVPAPKPAESKEQVSKVWDEEHEEGTTSNRPSDEQEVTETTETKTTPKAGNTKQQERPSQHHHLRGNKQVQRLLRESVVVLPAKIAKRLAPRNAGSDGAAASTVKGPPIVGLGQQPQPQSKGRGMNHRDNMSIMDRQTKMQPQVTILEGTRHVGTPGPEQESENVSVGEGEGTVVSVERSSIMVGKDHKILLGDLEEGDIDIDSIDRAKKFVCGGESWAEKSARILEGAQKDQEAERNQQEENEREQQQDTIRPVHAQPQLEVVTCISKSNDDLRQEVFVMQMIHYYKSVFHQAKLPLWLKTYRILSTSSSTGLIEVLTDATSMDGLKKSEGYPTEGGLRQYFETVYGGPDSKAFKAAQANFMQSLAAYSLVSYLLALKDRHNGNIMIDARGHLIHIDFGFAFGLQVAHEFTFERSPFKLTKEYVDVMGGTNSDCYKEFQRLFVAGFKEARKNSQIALGLVEIMMFQSNYPCFSGWRYGGGQALRNFAKRLMLNVPDDRIEAKALKLIRKSRQNVGTHMYDQFQKATNGYAI